MIELFLSLSNRQVGVLTPGQWNYVQKGLQRNVEKVQMYYRTFNPTTRSNHFLVRLLQSLSVPLSLQLDRYFANVDAVSLNHSMAMRMTSSIYPGTLHRGIFYGGSTPEILLAVDDFFDFEEVDRNWESAVAVRPLLHVKSDLGLHLPNGIPYSDETGLSVIEVNIAKLAVQYRAFRRAESRKPNGTTRTDATFIATYVLPNMLPAHLDLAIFNRLYTQATAPETDDNRPYRKHPFNLPEYAYYVDMSLEKAMEAVDKGSMEFEAVLKGLPAVFAPNQYQALRMPDVVPTLQVDWVLTSSRLKATDFLFRVCQDKLLARNQKTINQMLRSLRLNNAVQVMDQKYDTDVLREIQVYLGTILEGADRDWI